MNRAILHIALTAAVSLSALAQGPPVDPDAANHPPQPAYQQQQEYQYQQPPASPRLSPEELSNLVAPIALYPDMLLSQVLAASTYPAEIMQAQQWMASNQGLRGQGLVEAAKQQNWDPSVQALVAFPDVMNLLTRDVQWTTDLGNAFLSQQADLMDAIQGLRIRARDNGRLANTPQQRVTYEQVNGYDQENGQNAIVIQPTNPQVVYPPVYNPEHVWGPPASGAYPSLGYPDAGEGIAYGVATLVGALFSGLWNYGGWGWGLNWLSHGLFLNNLFFSHFGFHGSGGGYGFYGGGEGYGYAARSAWVHNPGHRLGVPYGNRYAGSRYATGSGNGGWRRFSSQGYGGNYSGCSYNTGQSDYAGSNYQGSSRQMDAYRILTQSASRGGGYSFYGSGYRGSGYGSAYGGGGYGSYRGGGGHNSDGGFNSYGTSYVGSGYGSGYRGGSFYNSQPRYSAPGYGSSRSYAIGAPQGGYRGGYSRGESPGHGWFGSSSHYSTPSHYSATRCGGPQG